MPWFCEQEESTGDLDGNGKQDNVTRTSQSGVTSHQVCVDSKNSAVAGSIQAAVAPRLQPLQHKFTKRCHFTSCVCGDIFGHVLSWMGR